MISLSHEVIESELWQDFTLNTCEIYRWEIYDEIDENGLFMANIAWLWVSYYSLSNDYGTLCPL